MDKINLPVVIPNKLLISPGIWNDNEYSVKEIEEAFTKTDWGDKSKISLWLNHDDRNTSAFVGYIKNPILASEGRVFGDLELWDEKSAILLTEAMAKFGISAKIKGEEDKKGKMHNFSFENFSIVTTPACSEAYINLSKKENLHVFVSKYLTNFGPRDNSERAKAHFKISDEEWDKLSDEEKQEYINKLPERGSANELKQITGMETERKKRGMSPSEFYALPREPPSESSLPIFDKEHTQNAMARFNQTRFNSPDEKASAKRKIIGAADKFGIKVSEEFKSLSNTNERRSKNMEEGLQEEKDKKKKKEEPIKENSEEELSEKDILRELSNKFDKLIELLSKKELQDEESEEEESEEESVEEEQTEDKEPEIQPEIQPETEENKELIAVKKELTEIKEKLNAPKSKTIRNLSSNSVGNEMKYNESVFCDFLAKVNQPVKFN